MHTRVLTPEQASELTDAERRLWITAGYLMPIAGAEEPDTEDEGADDGEAEYEGEEDEQPEDQGEGADEEDGDEDPRANISMAEYNRLRRGYAEAEKARKKAEREAKSRREREQKEQGAWQELIDERDENMRELEAERDEARYELDAYRRQIRVSSAAGRLGFKDPNDAARFLSQDETEDEPTTERALKRLAKQKPYLVAERRSSGVPVNGEGAGSGLTMDDIKNMTPEQVNENWEAVQRTMSAGGAR